MGLPETVKFEFTRHEQVVKSFENELVASLPGLLITQFSVPSESSVGMIDDKVVLRFDFCDDWYSVLVYLDEMNHPTGHYKIYVQTPLVHHGDFWSGEDMVVGMEIIPGFGYLLKGEEEFLRNTRDGWIQAGTFLRVRDTMRTLRSMLDEGTLPQEVMYAVNG